MRVNDLMEVMSLIAKLNRTVDAQETVINKYVEKYGPLEDDNSVKQNEPTEAVSTP